MRCRLLKWLILASACLSSYFMQLCCANTDERIGVLPGLEISGDWGNIVLDEGPWQRWGGLMRLLPNYFDHFSFCFRWFATSACAWYATSVVQRSASVHVHTRQSATRVRWLPQSVRNVVPTYHHRARPLSPYRSAWLVRINQLTGLYPDRLL